MSNLQTYRVLVQNELRRGLINRDYITEIEMDFLSHTEHQLDEFISEFDNDNLELLLPFLKQPAKDTYLISTIKDGVKRGTISRYPLGWGDKTEQYEKSYQLPDGSSLELWSHQKFSVIFTEFSNLPEIEFVSLGHYMTFIISLILKEYTLAVGILQRYDSLSDIIRTLCTEREQDLKQKKSLLLFYLFKGNAVKISKCPEVKKELMKTVGRMITATPVNGLYGILDGENDFGNMLTLQREAISRLNLL